MRAQAARRRARMVTAVVSLAACTVALAGAGGWRALGSLACQAPAVREVQVALRAGPLSPALARLPPPPLRPHRGIARPGRAARMPGWLRRSRGCCVATRAFSRSECPTRLPG